MIQPVEMSPNRNRKALLIADDLTPRGNSLRAVVRPTLKIDLSPTMFVIAAGLCLFTREMIFYFYEYEEQKKTSR